jgi:hypothetical protein
MDEVCSSETFVSIYKSVQYPENRHEQLKPVLYNIKYATYAVERALLNYLKRGNE